MFKTRITELLGIEHPILQGAMIYLSRAELVSAVSNAGGLGILAAYGINSPTELREEIKRTKSLTDKPFGVNFALFPTNPPTNYEEFFAAAIEEGVKIIETSVRSPGPYMKFLKDAGATVLHKVGSVRHARKAEALGVDAVTIVNFEATGHPLPDNVAGSVLIPLCSQAVKIPVIAAGGVADARGFVATLALGAEGIMMGTRFMVSQECRLHPRIKEWFQTLSAEDTATLEEAPGDQIRVARTEFTDKVQQMQEQGLPMQEIYSRLGGTSLEAALIGGEYEKGLIMAGQVLGLINDMPSVKEIIDGIIGEAEKIVRRVHQLEIS